MKAENFVIICAVAGTFLFWVQAILGVLLDFSYYSSAEYRLRRLLQRQSKRQISWWEVILFLVAGMFVLQPARYWSVHMKNGLQAGYFTMPPGAPAFCCRLSGICFVLCVLWRLSDC